MYVFCAFLCNREDLIGHRVQGNTKPYFTSFAEGLFLWVFLFLVCELTQVIMSTQPFFFYCSIGTVFLIHTRMHGCLIYLHFLTETVG